MAMMTSPTRSPPAAEGLSDWIVETSSPPSLSMAEPGAHLLLEPYRLHGGTEIAPADVTVTGQVIDDPVHRFDRQRGGVRPAQPAGVDSQHPPRGVHQRASTESRIEVDVTLQQPVDLASAPGPPGAGDDTHRAERGAGAGLVQPGERERQVAGLERRGIPEGRDREGAARDPEDREVGGRIASLQGRRRCAFRPAA